MTKYETDAFDHDEGARASSLIPVHKLATRDPIYDQQLLRDVELINARTRAELGPPPRKRVPEQAKRKPVLPEPTRPAALREGMCGFAVMELQALLKRLGYSDARGRPLATDGRFGPSTRTAVLGFQVEHGLEANGMCDEVTLTLVRKVVEDAERVESI